MKNLVNLPSQPVSHESAPLKLAATHFLRHLCLLTLSTIFPVVPLGWLTISTSHHSQFKDTVTLQHCRLEPPCSVLAVGKAVTISPDYVDHQIVNFNSTILATTGSRYRASHPTYRSISAELSAMPRQCVAPLHPTFGHDSFARMDP